MTLLIGISNISDSVRETLARARVDMRALIWSSETVKRKIKVKEHWLTRWTRNVSTRDSPVTRSHVFPRVSLTRSLSQTCNIPDIEARCRVLGPTQRTRIMEKQARVRAFRCSTRNAIITIGCKKVASSFPRTWLEKMKRTQRESAGSTLPLSSNLLWKSSADRQTKFPRYCWLCVCVCVWYPRAHRLTRCNLMEKESRGESRQRRGEYRGRSSGRKYRVPAAQV